MNLDSFSRAFGDNEWIDESTYVWGVNAQILSEVRDAIITKRSPIILIEAQYGGGKSAFRWALKYLIQTHSQKNNTSFELIDSGNIHHKTTEYMMLEQIANILHVNDQSTRRGKLVGLIKEEILKKNENSSTCLMVDDIQFMEPDAYFAIKTICDITNDSGQRVCPVILFGGEDPKTLVDAKWKKKLAQVQQRIQLQRKLEPFVSKDVFELIARASCHARGVPMSYDYRYPDAADLTTIIPFSEGAVLRIEGITRLPRQIKQLCYESAVLKAENADNNSPNRFTITAEDINKALASLKQRGAWN